jgi:hypothetical protein
MCLGEPTFDVSTCLSRWLTHHRRRPALKTACVSVHWLRPPVLDDEPCLRVARTEFGSVHTEPILTP